MTEVREHIPLAVPADQAERCIFQYFERYRKPDGAIEIPLQVMLADFGVPGGISIARTVTVHIAKQRDALNLNEEIALSWDPGPGQPFPSLHGSLTIWSEDGTSASVELRGTYEPPLGAAGQIFDDAVGRTIAKRTARQFLLTLAEGAQTCFQP